MHGHGTFTSTSGGWSFTGTLARDRPVAGVLTEPGGRRFDVKYAGDCALMQHSPTPSSKIGGFGQPQQFGSQHSAGGFGQPQPYAPQQIGGFGQPQQFGSQHSAGGFGQPQPYAPQQHPGYPPQGYPGQQPAPPQASKYSAFLQKCKNTRAAHHGDRY
jgi:hypothetical protein